MSANIDDRVVMRLVMRYYVFFGWGWFHRRGNLAVLKPSYGPPTQETPHKQNLTLCSEDLFQTTFVTRLEN